jgi:hypothetical protein
MKFVDSSRRARGQALHQRPAASRPNSPRNEQTPLPSAARIAAELAFSRSEPLAVAPAAPVVKIRRHRAVSTSEGAAAAVGSQKAPAGVAPPALPAHDGPKPPRVFRVEAKSPSELLPLPAMAAVPDALPPSAPTPPATRKAQGLGAEMSRLDHVIDEIRAAQAFSLNGVVADQAWRALCERALRLRQQAKAIRAKPSRGPF